MGEFAGFPRDLTDFLTELAETNTKEWFADNRDRYKASYRDPARAFVEAMAVPLAKISKSFNADPGNNGSIMRIHRDTRFSKDKSPYNPYLRLVFWEGTGKSRESTGFYFGIGLHEVFAGGGMYGFSPEQLKRYRAALNNPTKARALTRAISAVEAKGHTLSDAHLKRVPKDAPPDHPQADLFRFKGLYAGVHSEIEPWLFTPKAVDRVTKHFATVRPLQAWLAETLTP